jgi:cytochrome c
MRHVLIAAGLAALVTISAAAQDDASKPEFYTAKVLPILKQHCYQCHSAAMHSGGLNMEERDGFLKDAMLGPAVAPGDPANSLLMTLIKQDGPPGYAPPMPPPPNAKLSDADIATVEQWIKAGLVMPASAAAPAAAPAPPAHP